MHHSLIYTILIINVIITQINVLFLKPNKIKPAKTLEGNNYITYI